MIFDAIVSVLVGLFTGVLALLPGYELDLDMAGFASAIGGGAGTIGAVFPVGTLGICIAALIGFKVFAMAWAGLVFLYDRLPFKAT